MRQAPTTPPPKSQYGPQPSTKPHAPRFDAEHTSQERPRSQGVQGSATEQTGPSPFWQSRLEPTSFPPFALATQLCRMRGGVFPSGNAARTEALKM
jgi:hypothetical protein